MTKPLITAMSAWRHLLGSSSVKDDRETLTAYAANVSGLQRRIAAVLCPAEADEVIELVKIANRHRTPLYPIGTGKNWGYGSRLPVTDDVVLVDLSRLDRIRNAERVGAKEPFAVIEPGVTQGQLYRFLRERELPWFFNVTASGVETSILGNTLDRGFGYFSMRQEDLLGLEVVLGDGRLLKTGFGHYDQAAATHHFRYGLGPHVDGLFLQSNFGLVTAGGFRLRRRRERHLVMLAKLPDAKDLAAFVDIFGECRRLGHVESVVHIGSHERLGATLAPMIYEALLERGGAPGPELRAETDRLLAEQAFGSWSAVGGLFGSEGAVADAQKWLTEHLSSMAELRFFDEAQVMDHRADDVHATLTKRAVKPLVDFCLGIPSDGALAGAFWKLGVSRFEEVRELDQTDMGLFFIPPVFPLDGRIATEVVHRARMVTRQFGFTSYMTLNIIDERSIILILNIVFDRRDRGMCEQAEQCVARLYESWEEIGVYPYRLGVQSMQQLVREDDPFWRMVRDLKQVYDPNHIIAPGRYNLV